MSTDYTANNPHRGAWLVYLNGIEIPCPSVSVSYGVWCIPEATFTFPPHKLLHRLGNEDRLEVTIFYLDTLINPEVPQFRLLFEGEIVGWSYRNTATGRQMSFNAIADIAIFTQLYFFFMNNVETMVQYNTVQGIDANSIARPGVFFPFSLFQDGLVVPPSDTSDTETKPITKPFQLLYNAVKGLLDKKGDTSRAIPAVNFFARWCKKRNFQNKFAALPLFEDTGDSTAGVFPIFKAVQATTALQTLQTSICQSVGDSGNFFDVFKQLFGLVYMELAMLPTAPCYRTRVADGAILGPSTTPTKDKAAEPLRVASYFVKPQLLFAIPPSCNLIFPSMSPSFAYNESYMAQPTRTYVNDQFIQGTLGSQNAFMAAALTAAYPLDVRTVLQAAKGHIDTEHDIPVSGNTNLNSKNMLVFPEEFFKGPIVGRMPAPSWFQFLYADIPQDVGNDDARLKRKSTIELLELYAQYEYYRSRYEKRGGAADMAWNPYIVPGFPCVVFGSRSSSFDNIGVVLNVTQTMSVGTMRTSINYGFGRTLQEMLELLAADNTRLKMSLGCSPTESVEQLRDIGQDFTKAEQFYNALFHGRQAMGDRKASFDFREVIGYIKDDATAWYDEEKVLPITLGNLGEAVKHDLAPLPGFQPMFDSYDAAMKYIARPICTLQEYVLFRNGETPIVDLVNAGTVAGPHYEYTYDSARGDATESTTASAVYFDKIYALRPGPGARPPPAALGVNEDATIVTTAPKGVPENFAQTRSDWESVLKAYRAEILRESPQR